PEIEHRDDDTWRARTPIGAMRRSVAMYVDRAAHEVTDIRKALAAHQPDAVLVDNNCWGAAAALQASGLPWAQAATFLLPLAPAARAPGGRGPTPPACGRGPPPRPRSAGHRHPPVRRAPPAGHQAARQPRRATGQARARPVRPSPAGPVLHSRAAGVPAPG